MKLSEIVWNKTIWVAVGVPLSREIEVTVMVNSSIWSLFPIDQTINIEDNRVRSGRKSSQRKTRVELLPDCGRQKYGPKFS